MSVLREDIKIKKKTQLKEGGDNKKISSDFAENLCLGVLRGQELESGVRFPKFSSESG